MLDPEEGLQMTHQNYSEDTNKMQIEVDIERSLQQSINLNGGGGAQMLLDFPFPKETDEQYCRPYTITSKTEVPQATMYSQSESGHHLHVNAHILLKESHQSIFPPSVENSYQYFEQPDSHKNLSHQLHFNQENIYDFENLSDAFGFGGNDGCGGASALALFSKSPDTVAHMKYQQDYLSSHGNSSLLSKFSLIDGNQEHDFMFIEGRESNHLHHQDQDQVVVCEEVVFIDDHHNYGHQPTSLSTERPNPAISNSGIAYPLSQCLGQSFHQSPRKTQIVQSKNSSKTQIRSSASSNSSSHSDSRVLQRCVAIFEEERKTGSPYELKRAETMRRSASVRSGRNTCSGPGGKITNSGNQQQRFRDYSPANEESINHATSEMFFNTRDDLLIDLSWLKGLQNPIPPPPLQEDTPQQPQTRAECPILHFEYSRWNYWKRCVQIDKDTSENGCYYISVDSRVGSQLTPVQQIREFLFEHQDLCCDITRFIQTERVLDAIDHRRVQASAQQQQRDISGSLDKIEGMFPECLAKAKSIMRELVNANGSNKSFVFAQIKAFNPRALQQELTHFVYSPKLVQILYGHKTPFAEIFSNQIMRHGLIDFFDSTGQLALTAFELTQASIYYDFNAHKQSASKSHAYSATNNVAARATIILFTFDGFQIPITVTLKKFNLLSIVQQEANEKDSCLQNLSAEESHILLVFDIKVKIKYQKQLKKFREVLPGETQDFFTMFFHENMGKDGGGDDDLDDEAEDMSLEIPKMDQPDRSSQQLSEKIFHHEDEQDEQHQQQKLQLQQEQRLLQQKIHQQHLLHLQQQQQLQQQQVESYIQEQSMQLQSQLQSQQQSQLLSQPQSQQQSEKNISDNLTRYCKHTISLLRKFYPDKLPKKSQKSNPEENRQLSASALAP